MFVDLHVHSVYSDGMLTPEQLAADGVSAGVSLIALADHNTIAGCLPMRNACRAAGIGCIDAVEIDCLYRGEDLHMLAYGCDPGNQAFAAQIHHARNRLDNMTYNLIDALQAQGKCVSRAAYDAYPEQEGLGGWKGLYYLQDRLGLEDYYPVFSMYDEYGITYARAGFAPAEEVIAAIHGAGGLAVLAHPGDVSKLGGRVEAREMVQQMEELFRMGLDGAECCYPKHSPEATELFAQACRSHGKLITSGSDCHGAFSGKPVGYMKKTPKDLNLGPLLERIHR